MNRFFGRYCAFISFLLILSVIVMPFAAYRTARENNGLDLLGSNEIVEKIKNYEINLTSIVYAQNASGEWEEYQHLHGEENRIWVGLSQIPQNLINAFIAIEDQRFYLHKGVDWKRTASAFTNKFVHIYDSVQGGSTITQQLIKNITGDNARTSGRKIREIFRAMIIERQLSKNEILEAYLNTISLGNGICGVQVAANYYFNKDVSELTLTECAALAGITKNPSAYNPLSNSENNTKRRKTVLKKMYGLNYIDSAQYEEAVNCDLVLDTSQKSEADETVNNYFIDALVDELIEDLAEKYHCSTALASAKLYNGGYQIYATVQPTIQQTAEQVYSDVKTYFPQKATTAGHKGENVQSAVTVMDYSGHIVGIVGGVGEKTENRTLNRAIDSPRQPGSTMKPLGAYTPALESGVISANSIYTDSPIPDYYEAGKSGPAEWYGNYLGRMSVGYAIEHSVNTVACKVVQDLGIENSYRFLTEKLHLSHLCDQDKNMASMALGGCTHGITTAESAAAYAIFGNNGVYYQPTTYYHVLENNGKDVVLSQQVGERVIQPATAALMNKMLQQVVQGAGGTGRSIAGYSNMPVFAKTGTSSEANDLWMVAGTPYYVASVWYGFDYPQAVWNTSAAATVWRSIMKPIHAELEYKDFDLFDAFETKKYCCSSGKIACSSCTDVATGNYIPGLETPICDGSHIYEDLATIPAEEESAIVEEGASSAESSTAPAESSGETVTDSSAATDSNHEKQNSATVNSGSNKKNYYERKDDFDDYSRIRDKDSSDIESKTSSETSEKESSSDTGGDTAESSKSDSSTSDFESRDRSKHDKLNSATY